MSTRILPSPSSSPAVAARAYRFSPPTLALGALMVGVAILLLAIGHGTTFFFDEWDFVLGDYGGGLHAMLLPHNEHLSIVPIAVYKVLFHLARLDHYGAYRAVLVAYHLVCAGLIYVLARRRIGAWGALIAASLILVLGSAYDDLLWPFQIGFLGSIAGGLAAWLALERRDRSGDLIATAALLVAIGSSGLGIPFVVGTAAELAWQRRWRRLWIVAVPTVLYLAWYGRYGTSNVTGSSVGHAAPWAVNAVAASFGAVAGVGGLDWGRPLAVLGLLLLARWLMMRPAVSPRLAAVVVTGVAYWGLTAVSRSTIVAPDTPRYLYLGAVLIVLAGVELLRERQFPSRTLVLAGAGAVAATVTSLTALASFSDARRATDSTVSAELGALQLAAAHAPAGFQPDAHNAPQITSGPYLHVVRANGSSPAKTPREIALAGPQARVGADQVLAALEVSLVSPPAPGAPGQRRPPAVLSTAGVRSRAAGACVRLTPYETANMAVLSPPPGGIVVGNRANAEVAIAVKRYADTFTPVPGVPPVAREMLALAPDRSSQPWQVRLTLSGPVSVCD